MSGDRVLLIDDEPELLETLSERLEARGLIVVTADSGESLERAAVDNIPIMMVLFIPVLAGGAGGWGQALGAFAAKRFDCQVKAFVTLESSAEDAIGGARMEGYREGYQEHCELPEKTVVLFIGNYAPEDQWWIGPDGKPVRPDSPQFFAEWRAQSEKIVTELEASGTEIYWVLPPPVGNDAGNETIHLNGSTGDIILRNGDAAEDFDVADPDAVLLRSFDLRAHPLPESVLAVGRAGIGVPRTRAGRLP